jgi:hypothetical protein
VDATNEGSARRPGLILWVDPRVCAEPCQQPGVNLQGGGSNEKRHHGTLAEPFFVGRSFPVFQKRVRSMPKSAKPFPRKRPAIILIGAQVRLRRGGATGVVIANSTDIDRVQVRWDATGEVTHCPKANLTLVFPA